MPQPAAKRARPTVGSALKKTTKPAPDYAKGVEYWNNIDASVDGVLGGFGEGVRFLSFPCPHTPTPRTQTKEWAGGLMGADELIACTSYRSALITIIPTFAGTGLAHVRITSHAETDTTETSAHRARRRCRDWTSDSGCPTSAL